MNSIQITDTISISMNELKFEFIRASGPGGQNVNKVASAVQLRFDIPANIDLSEEIKERLHRIAKNRINANGTLIIEAKKYRSQEQNRKDAIHRFTKIILKAIEKPKVRKPTKISKATHERRLKAKRETSEKKLRRRDPLDED